MKKEKTQHKKILKNKPKDKLIKADNKNINFSDLPKALPKPTSNFAQVLAHEIAKNLNNFGQFTIRPFKKTGEEKKTKKRKKDYGDNPILIDSSVLIDSRIINVINSGFMTGTLLVPEFVLQEVQHVADSPDKMKRSRGRLGLEVAAKIKNQKTNDRIKVKIIKEEIAKIKEVDHKLVELAKKDKIKLMTVDYNLAQLARAQGIKVLNINDLATALKTSLIPGQSIKIRISHEGKGQSQGVGYLDDGTMIIIEEARGDLGKEIDAEVTKTHQSPAGQIFFAKKV